MKNSLVARVRRFINADSEGNALVEMAVTLPLIMLIMTGIFSFSMALYQKLQLAEAVAAAGRQLAVDRGSHDPCADVMNAIYNGAPGLSQTSLNQGIVITINGTTEPSGSCPGPGTTGASADLSSAQGKNAQVQVTYPITLSVVNIWGSGQGFGNVNLISQVTEVVQ
ncbi:MAG TPA: TadE/TadG family type IV pilus assembly protein [Terracidiphilus sp.]|jgi:Flp pilus assembly protein TadG|nr:TadE/TadG family type IV pilus assembly protein [Terracidiphilus sp.]